MEIRKGKMDRAERAKQFMPFDALAGLQEALREREKEAEEERKTEGGQSEEDGVIANKRK